MQKFCRVFKTPPKTSVLRLVIPMGLRNAKHCSAQRPLSSLQMLPHFLLLSVYVALADKKAKLFAFLLSEPSRVRAHLFLINTKTPSIKEGVFVLVMLLV